MSHTELRRLLPHGEAMCLLESVRAVDETGITCMATSHRDPGNPLRHGGALWAIAGLEYAAQAMALHIALTAEAAGNVSPRIGLLGGVRDLKLGAERLDEAAAPLSIRATRLLGEEERYLYRFLVTALGREILTGRASIFLQHPPSHEASAGHGR